MLLTNLKKCKCCSPLNSTNCNFLGRTISTQMNCGYCFKFKSHEKGGATRRLQYERMNVLLNGFFRTCFTGTI